MKKKGKGADYGKARTTCGVWDFWSLVQKFSRVFRDKFNANHIKTTRNLNVNYPRVVIRD
jgi:hypothetical protein